MSRAARCLWVTLFLAAGTFALAATAIAQTALQFDGVNKYVTFGAAPSLGTATFTLEVRFKRTGAGAGTSTGTGGLASAVPLIAKGRAEGETPATANMNYFLGIDTATNKLCVDFEDTAGGLNHPLVGTTVVTSGVWHHAAATYDGTTWRIYLDGNLDVSAVIGATPEATSLQHAALGSALTTSGAAAGFFAGILDEARIWNVARTQAEIQANQNVEIHTAPGLIGHWALDEGAGNSAGNSVAGGVNGTLINGPAWTPDTTVPLLTASALRLGGAATGYVTFGDPAGLDLAQFTLECWFRKDGTGTPNTTGGGGVVAVPLIAHGGPEAETPPSVNMNYFLGIRDTGVLCADFEEGGAGASPGQNHPVSGTTVIANGVWHHAAATYDGSTWRLYLDGSLEATLVVGQPVESNTFQHASLGTTLGSNGLPPASNSLWFNGAIDEARIWNSARSQSDIASTLNSEITGPAPGLVARWGMNEDASTSIASSAGAVVNGTLTGTNWSWTAGSPFNAVLAAPPDAPTGLTATALSGSRIDLAWTDVATTETGYEVERSTTGVAGTYAFLVALPAGATSYSNTGLASASEFCYRVRAVGAGGPSGYASPACATTQVPIPPAAPTNLVATATSFDQVHLAWIDNASDETGYEVERSTTGVGGTYAPVITLGAGAVSYDDTGQTPASETCYRVRAVSGAGPSTYATAACATTPGSALDFGSAGTTYVTFGDPAALDLAQFTVECWFRRDGPGVGISTGVNGIVAVPLVTHGAPEADGSNVDANYFLGIRSSDGVLCADFEEGAAGATPGSNHPVAGVTPVGNGWHHAAATYDGTTWRLYLDGNLETMLVVGQPVQSGSIQRAALATALTSTGATNGFFNGVLDEVRVWSVARTPAEIHATANVALATPTAGLAARWALDEGTGTGITGSAGTTVNGTITGADFTWTAAAPFDLAFTPPAAPAGLNATAGTSGQITLAWSDLSDNESGFEIERSTTGIAGTYAPLATTAPNATSYVDPALSPSTEYCYRIRAVNGSGVSSYDGPACATTLVVTNGALRLTGSAAQPSYASFGSPAALRLSAFTIEMWLRRDGPGEGTNTGAGGIADAIPLVARGRAETETATTDINYFLGIRAATGALCGDFEEGAAGTSPSLNHPIEGVTPLAIGTWYHVAGTYDGTAWKLYVNGNLDAAIDVGQPLAAASTVAAALGSALTSANAPAGFFNGTLDEVRIWNVARDESQIQAAANTRITVPTPGLVARWSLDETSGTAIGASAGTTVDGTITGPNYAWTGPGAPFDLSFNHQPALPVPLAPADNATDVPTSPSLDVAVSDPDGGDLTVTWYGRPRTGSPGPDFTLIGLPDTQYYTGQLNGGSQAIFDAQTNWIVANRVARNIAYVGQLGDCTEHGDNGGNSIEWQRANASLGILENPATTGLADGVPFGVCVGNHDQSPIGDANGTTTFYNQYFGASRFTGRTYYGGHYGATNDNWYELFSASGMDFLVVSFGYDTSPDPAILAWGNDLLTTYANRRAIVLSHFICNTGNPAGFGPQGQAIYDALKAHANLDLMLCGHVPGEGRRQDTFNGNTVYTMLSDYQSRTAGGNGWLRILEFSPANNEIRVKTYSPWLNQFENDGDSEFNLPYDMHAAPPYQLIGTVSGVASGTTASLTWPGLAAASAYEWYATVSDGASSSVGPVRSFTTAANTTHTLTYVAGPNGSIAGPNPQTVTHGANGATVTAVPASGYLFANWSDGVTTAARSETNVIADLTVTANFAAGAAVVSATSPAVVLSPNTPHAAIPIRVERAATTPVLGFSVSFHLDRLKGAGSAPPAVTMGDFLGQSGASVSQPFMTDHGNGDYSIDGSTLGTPCGSGGTAGTLFTVTVDANATSGQGTLTITGVQLRDCANNPLAAGIGTAASVAIDFTAPTAALTSPNGGEAWLAGSAHVVTWAATDSSGIPSGAVTLESSTDGGAAWSVLAGGLDNTGSHAWTLPSVVTTTALVRLTVHDSHGNVAQDVSDAVFAIQGSAAVTVASSANPSAFGQAVTFTATITPPAATGSVQFKVDGNDVGAPVPVTAGSAASPARSDLAVGTHAIEVAYSGDAAYAGATGVLTGGQAVIAAGTAVTFTTGPAPWVFEEALALAAHVSVEAPGQGVPGGAVEFLDGATVVATSVLDGSGEASASVASLTPGTHSLSARYAGAGGFGGSVSAATDVDVQLRIVATAGASGSIAPTGTTLHEAGSTPAYAFTPDAGHHLAGVSVDGGAVAPVSPYTFAPLAANHTIDAQFAVNPAVDPITTLTATPVKSGNTSVGRTRVGLGWSPVAAGSTVNVYRAPFGSYPEYGRAAVPGAAPTAPSWPPGAPWELTAVHTSGDMDLPEARDFWYYAAFVTDQYGTTSPVSNLTAGTLDYYLGDVSDGFVQGHGDNRVNVGDISLLGAHYGAKLAPGSPFDYLDVGPTSDHGVDALPVPDGVLDFEDLVMFAINYGVEAPPMAQATAARPAAAAADAVTLEAPRVALPGAPVTARLRASGTGRVHALAVVLTWDPAIVAPESFTAGAMLAQQNGVAFSACPGAYDLAILGRDAPGFTGDGEALGLTFKVLAVGDPRFRLVSVAARDAANREVAVAGSTTRIDPIPARTGLSAAIPSPFRSTTTLVLSLARKGRAEVAIYSVAGRKVATLATGTREAGEYPLVWDGRASDGRALDPGVYYAQLVTEAGHSNRKLVLMR